MTDGGGCCGCGTPLLYSGPSHKRPLRIHVTLVKPHPGHAAPGAGLPPVSAPAGRGVGALGS